MNILEYVINVVSPRRGLIRAMHRQKRNAINNLSRKFEGAGNGRRHSGWISRSNENVNQVINKDLRALVSRSREISINDPYAKKAPITLANNIIGTGIIGVPYIVGSDVIEKRKDDSAGSLQKVITSWNEWQNDLNCDYNSELNFSGLQYLAMRSIVVSGEILIIKRRVPSVENKYGLQLQLIEGDFIDTSITETKTSDGGFVEYGIRYNSQGKKTGMYLFDRHPSYPEAKSSFVPTNDIIHIFDIFRVGQNRGVPESASTLIKQRDLSDYEDAELLGKKAQSCMPIFVTKQNSPEDDGNNLNSPLEEIEPGQINYMNPGESIVMGSPPASTGFESFTRTQHRAISNGYNLTYEMYTGDLSTVNFSSGRMGAIEFQKTVEYWQYTVLIPKLCERIFQWFMETAKVTLGIPKETIFKANWTAPKRQMIDPLKEVTAARLSVRSGFNSWQNIVKENGYSPDDILADQIAANKAFKTAGLMPEFDASFDANAKIEMNSGGKKTTSTDDTKPQN